MLDEELHRLGLRNLRYEREFVEIGARFLAEQRRLIGHEPVAAARMARDQHVLCAVHRPGAVVHGPDVFALQEFTQARGRGAAVIAGLADERRAREPVKVVLEEGARPPCVLLGHIVGVKAVRNFGRGAHKIAIGIVLLERAHQRLMRHAVIARVVVRIVKAHVLCVDLVVARPYGQRRVIAYPAYDRGGLLLDDAREIAALRIVCVAHAEVLPHHHAAFVAQFEEAVALVNAAAP